MFSTLKKIAKNSDTSIRLPLLHKILHSPYNLRCFDPQFDRVYIVTRYSSERHLAQFRASLFVFLVLSVKGRARVPRPQSLFQRTSFSPCLLSDAHPLSLSLSLSAAFLQRPLFAWLPRSFSRLVTLFFIEFLATTTGSTVITYGHFKNRLKNCWRG